MSRYAAYQVVSRRTPSDLLARICLMLIATALTCTAVVTSSAAANPLVSPQSLLGQLGLPEVNPTLTTVLEKDAGLTTAAAQHRVLLQQKAGQLNAQLRTTLGDRYAGVWYDNNTDRIKVGVLSDADSTVASSVAGEAGIQSSIDMVPVKASWAKLVSTQEGINDRLKALFDARQVKTGIAPQSNAVEVELAPTTTSADRQTVNALTQELGSEGVTVTVSYPNASTFEVKAHPAVTCTTSPAGYNAMCNRPVRGATIIYSGNIECSAGLLARREGNIWLMTAGHCIAESGGSNKTWYMYDKTGTPHALGNSGGFVFGERYPNPGGTRDSGAINIPTTSYWHESLAAEAFAYTFTEYYLTIGIQEPYVGATLCHLGISTPNDGSGTNCGSVLHQHVSVTYSEGNRVNDMNEISSCGHAGDSGGPYYGNYVAFGLESGGTSCPQHGGWNSGISYFDGAGTIQYEHGVLFYTEQEL